MLCVTFNNPSLCFSEQDLLDILLVRHCVDYYHCDCCPNLQTTPAVQLQIARWATAVDISHHFVSLRKAPKKKENTKVMHIHLFQAFYSFTYWPQACQISQFDEYSSFLSKQESFFGCAIHIWPQSNFFVFLEEDFFARLHHPASCDYCHHSDHKTRLKISTTCL